MTIHPIKANVIKTIDDDKIMLMFYMINLYTCSALHAIDMQIELDFTKTDYVVRVDKCVDIMLAGVRREVKALLKVLPDFLAVNYEKCSDGNKSFLRDRVITSFIFFSYLVRNKKFVESTMIDDVIALLKKLHEAVPKYVHAKREE